MLYAYDFLHSYDFKLSLDEGSAWKNNTFLPKSQHILGSKCCVRSDFAFQIVHMGQLLLSQNLFISLKCFIPLP